MEIETTFRLDLKTIKSAIAEHLSKKTNTRVSLQNVELTDNEAIVVVKGQLQGSSSDFSTRSTENRQYLDSLVMAQFMEDANIQNAEGIRNALNEQGVRISPMQLRASLRRLLSAGKITQEGQARGTLYILAEEKPAKKRQKRK